MQAQIEFLASLQLVDREIKQQSDLKQGLLGELQAKEREIEAKKQEVDGLRATCAEREKLRAEKDRVFQDEGKKAMDKRMRMNRIKNAKELQALQREIDLMRHSNGELEDEVIGIMQEIDGIKATLGTKEAEMSALQEGWQKQQQEFAAQIRGIDHAVSEVSTRRQAIAAQIARDVVSRYELIFSRRGGTAVVEVAGGICQGCYMNIPPQLSNEIVRSDKIHLCPSCQRFVYIKPAEEQTAKTA